MSEKTNLRSLIHQKKHLFKEYSKIKDKYESEWIPSKKILKKYEDLFVKSWEGYRNNPENSHVIGQQFFLDCEQLTNLIFKVRLIDAEMDRSSIPLLKEIRKIDNQIRLLKKQSSKKGDEKD